MATARLDELLKLPPNDRIEITWALRDSIEDIDHHAAIDLTNDRAAELD